MILFSVLLTLFLILLPVGVNLAKKTAGKETEDTEPAHQTNHPEHLNAAEGIKNLKYARAAKSIKNVNNPKAEKSLKNVNNPKTAKSIKSVNNRRAIKSIKGGKNAEISESSGYTKNIRKNIRTVKNKITRDSSGKISCFRERITRFFECFGLFLLSLSRRIRSGNTDDPAFYDSPERKKTADREKFRFYLLSYGLLVAASLLLLGLSLHRASRKPVNRLLRPPFGDEAAVQLTVTGLSDKEESLTVSLLSKQADEKTLEAFLDAAYEQVLDEALSENLSWDHVTGNLAFPDETASGIQVRTVSHAPEIISSRGFITADSLPEEGLSVSFSLTLFYEKTEKTYEKTARLFPETRILSEKEQLDALVDRKNRTEREDDYLYLPDTLDGRPLQYYEKTLSPWLVFLLPFAAAVFLFIYLEERQKELDKKRKDRLMLSYPGLVSRLSTLIMADLSVRSAWERIVSEKKAAGKTSGDPLFEEMNLTLIRLQQGTGEADAYVAFGRRTGLRPYQRLGNLLKNNLRQGHGGLKAALEEELQQSLLDRKNTALILGEKAASKLLFPMLLMLLIVILILMVPALFSF